MDGIDAALIRDGWRKAKNQDSGHFYTTHYNIRLHERMRRSVLKSSVNKLALLRMEREMTMKLMPRP